MDNSSLWAEYKSSPTPALKKRIIVNYTKLVHYVIHHSKFASHSILDERDYFQFGIEGLSEAIDRFDPNFGTKFETYAIKRIRGKIIDELRKLQKKNSFGDGVVVYSNVSIDTPLDDDENFSLSDTLPSDYDNPDVELEKNEAIELLGEAIKELPDRDRTILGLYYYEHLNYQEISQVLNITVSRISQIHSKIIKTLKTKLTYINA
jgi:RNA polymerase sigma factor for flagellar operon FliA